MASSKIVFGKVPESNIDWNTSYPDRICMWFSPLQHEAAEILPELGNDHFLPNVFISIVNKSS